MTNEMANAEKFEEKLRSLREKLQNIGHVPSIAEDRAINANVKYYYKNYPNHPLVKKLMVDFPLEIGRRGAYTKHSNIESRASLIEEQLKTLGRVPTSDENKSLLAEINYCYRTYSSNKEIKRLSKLYPTNTIYSKWGPKGNRDSFSESFCMGGAGSKGNLLFGPITYFEDPFTRAKRYILECIEEYNELPGVNTWPMHFVLEKFDGNYRNSISSEYIEFVDMLIKKGIAGRDIQTRYYSSLLDKSPLFDRICSILRKRRICSIGYLSKNIMPGVEISCDSLYQFFYYVDQNKGYPSNGIDKSHRHLFRLIDFQAENAGRIVSLPLEALLHIDYKSIATNQTINTLPAYSMNFTEEEEIQYANAFLFHIDTEHNYLANEIISTIDYSKSILDDLKEGICPFRFLDKYPFYDDADATIEWCNQLAEMESALLGVYLEEGKFFHSFGSITKKLSSNSYDKAEKLMIYLKRTYKFDITT